MASQFVLPFPIPSWCEARGASVGGPADQVTRSLATMATRAVALLSVAALAAAVPTPGAQSYGSARTATPLFAAL